MRGPAGVTGAGLERGVAWRDTEDSPRWGVRGLCDRRCRVARDEDVGEHGERRSSSGEKT